MIGLTEQQQATICSVLRRHPAVSRAILFGSRAKATHTERSDIDLALEGIQSEGEAEAIRSELEESNLPQRFDVLAMACIQHQELREHIQRVGLPIYPKRGA